MKANEKTVLTCPETGRTFWQVTHSEDFGAPAHHVHAYYDICPWNPVTGEIVYSGAEAWQAMVDYEFTHTDCDIVAGSPNVQNVASIKMMEAAGAVRVDEGVYEFPDSMKAYTTAVHCYGYHLARADWERHDDPKHPDCKEENRREKPSNQV